MPDNFAFGPNPTSDKPSPNKLLQTSWTSIGGDPDELKHIKFSGIGVLPSAFHVTELAAATIGVASLAVAELSAVASGALPTVGIDRRLASYWFLTSLRPQDWSLPPQWDPIAGDYQAADGWIRLHTNAPHHRDVVLSVLGTPIDKSSVEQAVEKWNAADLEAAIVERGGCAASMRTQQAWAEHPQGLAVNAEPLIHLAWTTAATPAHWTPMAERPLQGIRVLDLTRILAGPVATRFLAAFGADVLRIDPFGWEEPGTVPEVVLGKRCARLDLKTAEGRDRLSHLIAGADVIVHGYRPGALADLGFDPAQRRAINPNLIDVCLDAYGWTGPWKGRRGFDSLIQMSTGIADTGMRLMGRDRPTPLPGQSIDHGTGYLMAAAVVRGLTERLRTGRVLEARASLARTAQLLVSAGHQSADTTAFLPEQQEDLSDAIERTGWGPARRLRPPAAIDGVTMGWDLPAPKLGSSPPVWLNTKSTSSTELTS